MTCVASDDKWLLVTSLEFAFFVNEENGVIKVPFDATDPCLSACVSGSHAAIATDKKRLKIFEFNASVNAWELLHDLTTSRKSSRILFSQNERTVIVADRSGGVWRYALEENPVVAVRIDAHCSLLLDAALFCSHHNSLFATAVRDAKIRIGCYPNVYNIKSILVGHAEAVTSIMFLNINVLISGSIDHSIKVWDVTSCRQLLSMEQESPVKSLFQCESFIGVLMYSSVYVNILKFDEETCTLRRVKQLQLTAQPNAAICFQGSLIVVSDNKVFTFDCQGNEVKLAFVEILHSSTICEPPGFQVADLKSECFLDNVESYAAEKSKRNKRKLSDSESNDFCKIKCV